MSLLTELRTLLIDARIALRDANPAFDEDPLRPRLEQAIRDISEYVMPPPASNTKTTAAQVALAWQTVCRGLKLSDAKLYDELAAKVMSLLDEKELVEPVTELLQLDTQVRQLEASQKSAQTRLTEQTRSNGELRKKLDQLYQALAAAVPAADPTADPHTQALARLDEALAGGGRKLASGKPGAGAKAAPAVPEGPVPDRRVLEAVGAGQRPFTREQRDWSAAECLVLTGWQYTPLELIEKGDAWMAQQILASPGAPA
jgi:hypothetical protein